MKTAPAFLPGLFLRVAVVVVVLALVCFGALCLWIGPTGLRAFWGAKQFLEAHYEPISSYRLKLVMNRHERFPRPPGGGRFVFTFDYGPHHGRLEARYREQPDGTHFDYALPPE